MVAIIETIDHQGDYRDFHLVTNSIEQTLDVISTVSKCCLLIREAYLIENGKWIKLPVDVFDGQSFSGPIAELELEWTQLLDSKYS